MTLTLLDPQRRLPVAVGDAGTKTARDLIQHAFGVASALPTASVGGNVAVVCSDRYYFAVAVVGVWLAGHRVVLAPNDREATLRGIHDHQALLATLGDGQGAANIDVGALAPRDEAGLTLPAFEGARIAALLFSSGTTGTPVVYEKTFAQVLGEAHLLSSLVGLDGACVLPTVPSHHIYGLLAGVLAPLSGGACFVRETPLHVGQIVRVAERHGATVLVASPAHLKGVALWAAEEPATQPSSLALKVVVSSGAPLPTQTAQTIAARLDVKVVELFGSTETGGIAQRTNADAHGWTPLPGVSVSTALAQGRSELPPDQLLVRSSFTGHDGWFATGDLVQTNDDGSFVHKGRNDTVVKVGARRVDLGAVERCVAGVRGVLDVAVMGFPAPAPRDLEIACAVVAPGVCVQDIRNALLEVFEPVAVPRRWRFVERLPRHDNGKLTRENLASLFDGEPQDPSVRITCEARTALRVSADEYSLSIHVPRLAWFFQGHFEGDPLVPAVVQVNDIVLAHAQHLYPNLGRLKQANRLKFRHPIRPSDQLTVRLGLADTGQSVQFEMLVGDLECSSGVLDFEAGSV